MPSAGQTRAPVPLSIPLPRLSPARPKLSALPTPRPPINIERIELAEDSDLEDDAPTGMISSDDVIFAQVSGLGEAHETELEDDIELLDDELEPATTELRPEDLFMVEEVLTSATPMHLETSGQAIDEELEEEATSLFDSHTSLSEHSPFDSAPLTYEAQPAGGALDQYEEEGATVVFDSMSGKKLPAMQRNTAPGLHLQHHSPTASLIPPSPSQGIVDEFSAMSTQLLQSPFEREHLAPKLRVITGPTLNQESFVTGLRSTIGRGEQNSIVIGDAAMSRNHFEILKNPDESFTLRDSGSANGTQLNGQLIREAALFHGDRIEAGKSVLEFDCPDVPAKPHRHLIAAPIDTFQNQDQLDEKTSLAAFQLDQSTRFFTRVSIGAALVCIPLIGVLITLSLRPPAQAKAPTPAHVQAQAQGPGIPIHKAKAATLYLEGVEAMKVRDWGAAESQFKRAKVMDESLNVSAQLALLEREGDAQRALERAKALSTQEKFEEVNAQVDAIPKESVYYAEAQQLRRQQRLGDVAELYEQAQAQLTADALDDAAASIAAILKLSPQHDGAKKLESALSSRREELLKKQRAEEEAAQAAASNKGEHKDKLEVDPFGTPSTPRPTNASSSGSLQDGLNLYKRGKFDQAIRALEGVSGPDSGKASKVAAQIKQFKGSYSQGNSAIKAKSWSKAVSLLDKAYKADARISSAYKSELSTQLALAHGEQGLGQLRAKKYKDARTELVAGQKIQSKHPKLAELNRELESEATKLYIQAANKKKTDPDAASLLCRQILLMTPFSSPTSKKAQRLLGEL